MNWNSFSVALVQPHLDAQMITPLDILCLEYPLPVLDIAMNIRHLMELFYSESVRGKWSIANIVLEDWHNVL